MKCATWIASGLLAFASSSWGQAPAQAFQGLNWGDSVDTIQQKFPAVRFARLSGCSGESIADSTSMFASSCTAGKFSGYNVGGLKFDVTFYLSLSDKALSEVGLGTFIAADSAPVSLAKCKEIESLLADRYGVKHVTVNDKRQSDALFRSVHFVDAPGATKVALYCDSAADGSSVRLSYSPKVPLAARKL